MILVGYCSTKAGLIKDEAISTLSGIVVTISVPCLLLTAFDTELTPESLNDFFLALTVAVGVHIFAIAASMLLIREHPGSDRRVLVECASFTNCGFFGIPMILALMGNGGMFYGAPYNLIYGIIFWTAGIVYFRQGSGTIEIKKILLNPANISIIISLILFLMQIRLPLKITTVTNYLGGLSTPLSMLIIGSNLCKTSFKSTLCNTQNVLVIFLRLIAYPLALMLIMHGFGIGGDVMLAAAIMISSPVASMTAIMARECGRNAEQASSVVSISSVLAVITMPFMISLAYMLK